MHCIIGDALEQISPFDLLSLQHSISKPMRFSGHRSIELPTAGIPFGDSGTGAACEHENDYGRVSNSAVGTLNGLHEQCYVVNVAINHGGVCYRVAFVSMYTGVQTDLCDQDIWVASRHT